MWEEIETLPSHTSCLHPHIQWQIVQAVDPTSLLYGLLAFAKCQHPEGFLIKLWYTFNRRVSVSMKRSWGSPKSFS